MGYFDHLDLMPPDPILGLTAAFQSDPRSEKIDLSVGIYRNEKLQAEKMRAVIQAEKVLLNEEVDKNYLPIDGCKGEIQGIKRLVFGEDLFEEEGPRIVGVQGLGGTGSIRVGLEFLKKQLGTKVFVPEVTWANHLKLVKYSNLELFRYPYYEENRVCFKKALEAFHKMPEKSVVILHGCCHNPTGADFTAEQWKEISALFLKKRLFPFFDLAYQGFGDGLERDAFAIRHFTQEGHEMAVAQSCSKNFGLYGERVGTLFILTEKPQIATHVLSHVKPFIRANYSNPPIHGAAIVSKILSDPKLKQVWKEQLDEMRLRIQEMREALVKALESKSIQKDFSFMKKRKGMFSFTGLTEDQSYKMIKDHAIYLTSDGRINVCGLNDENIDRVADAIKKVLA
ncbi:MAG: amino acid aminotransferase [Simkaniaceae bacterium]